jgi:hypothetical protein
MPTAKLIQAFMTGRMRLCWTSIWRHNSHFNANKIISRRGV